MATNLITGSQSVEDRQAVTEKDDPKEYKGKPAQGEAAPMGYVDEDEDRRS